MRQKGITPVIILVVVAALILLGSAGAYYYLKMSGGFLNVPKTTSTTNPPGETPISNFDDSATLESELDATQIDSVEGDINELETSASSL